MSASSSSIHQNPLTSHFADLFSDSYVEAQNRILKSAKEFSEEIHVESLPIAAKGYDGEDLAVNIIWIGPRDSTNIIIHISGTHGVEGFAGSAIQSSLLQNPIPLPENTSMILIHGLNPYGMAHLRRVTENNVDLNRNFSADRRSPPSYAKINDLINPKEYEIVDGFTIKLFWEVIFGEGWDSIKNSLANGQYRFPEGLFYGGQEIEEAPRLVFEWFEKNFNGKTENLQISIIDVHTGLGDYAKDTLLTIAPPTEKMKSVFGKKISAHAQDNTTGYQPTGMFVEALQDLICRITQCTKDKITVIGQEFGTSSMLKVLNALRNENTFHHEMKRKNIVLDPAHPLRQDLFTAFYPKEPKWKLCVLKQGRELITQVIKLLEVSKS